MNKILSAIAGVLATAGCGGPVGDAAPAAGRPSPIDPAAAAAALEAWRAEPPWNGWQLMQETLQRDEAINPTADYASPAFEKVIDSFKLRGKPLTEFISLLGDPEPAPAHLSWLIDMTSHGSASGHSRLYAWKGSAIMLLDDRPTFPIDAKVVSVGEDQTLVTLSAGTDERVEVGHRFTIYRGPKYVARVEVTKVWKDGCAARILTDRTKGDVAPGDDAATRVVLEKDDS